MEADWKRLTNGIKIINYYQLYVQIFLKLVKRVFELALTYFTGHFKRNQPEALAGLVSLSVNSFFIGF